MLVKNFPNSKLNLPNEIKKVFAEDSHCKKSFEAIDTYLETVAKYIYTDINHNYELGDLRRSDAWLLRLVSSSLIRSLYIRNQLVDSINSRNFVCIFLPLKAWIELVGLFASILNLVEKKLPSEEMIKELGPYLLGNRGDSKIGTIEAKSVITMIKKADKYLSKLSQKDNENFFSFFYEVSSNPTHPSYDSLDNLGTLNNYGVWQAETPEFIKNKITTDLNGYGGLLMSPIFIVNICEKIFEIKKDDFNELNCKKYFD
jgi:hypothetical protein